MSARLNVEIDQGRCIRGARLAHRRRLRNRRPRGTAATRPARLTLGGTPPRVRTEGQLQSFLDDLESQQFAITTAFLTESYYQWRAETTHRAAETARLRNDLLNRRDYAAIVEAWDGKVQDSVLARHVALHRRAFRHSKADPALGLRYSDLQSPIRIRSGCSASCSTANAIPPLRSMSSLTRHMTERDVEPRS